MLKLLLKTRVLTILNQQFIFRKGCVQIVGLKMCLNVGLSSLRLVVSVHFFKVDLSEVWFLLLRFLVIIELL